jgi:hypothetical protein
MKVESKLTFGDGKTADVTLQLTRRSVKLSTLAEGVTNTKVWDRNHVVSIDAFAGREGQIFPTLHLCNGDKVNLGIILSAEQARQITDAF